MDKGLEQKLEVLTTISIEYPFLYRLQDFRKAVAASGEDIVFRKFPNKVVRVT
jgi:hypothetical protein